MHHLLRREYLLFLAVEDRSELLQASNYSLLRENRQVQ